ncbi:hypothetical protein DFJ75_4977 [Williamsia muralis]|uniref:Uncharacterized protein n=1 Tax=Williamsia marianensis TaxID=85044 RepID=A0A495IUZ2_WILMA|nr:hypothetical protein [Williamsia muralis]RKR79834.1 hypothetical protein DFJ75_4977 [Williamsia muralis]
MTRTPAMKHVYNHTKMPGDPAYTDLDDDTKFVLFDLAVTSPEAHVAAATVIDPPTSPTDKERAP